MNYAMTHTKAEIQKHNNNVTNPVPTGGNSPAPEQSGLVPSRPSDGDRWQSFALDSIRRKQRADSFFHSLSAAQQELLLKWITETPNLWDVQKRIAAAPPHGFG